MRISLHGVERFDISGARLLAPYPSHRVWWSFLPFNCQCRAPGSTVSLFIQSTCCLRVLEVEDKLPLADGGPLRHLWSAATQPTPFLSGVVVIFILQLAMPRSGVHRFGFGEVHMVVEGA